MHDGAPSVERAPRREDWRVDRDQAATRIAVSRATRSTVGG
jgi:hypothetical protein